MNRPMRFLFVYLFYEKTKNHVGRGMDPSLRWDDGWGLVLKLIWWL
jgi:hypothetical protein